MNETFFLTRQSANLIEDFATELSMDSAIFLLYGEERIGKTRLLQELQQRRLTPANVHWIDFKLNQNEAPEDIDFRARIKAFDQVVKSGDIIIADHFDLADSRLQRKLLKSWTIDIADRKANMILVTGVEGLAICRQLSQQFQVSIKSFHQLPYSRDEVDAFIALRLFPENPLARLSIPAQLNKQINNASGVVGRVIDIIDRDGAQIHQLKEGEPEQNAGPWRALIVTLVAVFVVGGIFLLATVYTDPKVQSAEAEVLPPVEPAVVDQPANVGPELESVLDEPALIAELVTPDEPSMLVAEGEDENSSAESKVEIQSEAVPVIETESDEPASNGDSINDGIDQTASVETGEERFNKLLERSMKWFKLGDRSQGAIQIMSIKIDNFNYTAFYDYLDKLQNSRVDLSQIRVYRTVVRGVDYYYVLYGDYLNRRFATEELANLPDLLKRNGAIIRSLGGIQDDLAKNVEG